MVLMPLIYWYNLHCFGIILLLHCQVQSACLGHLTTYVHQTCCALHIQNHPQYLNHSQVGSFLYRQC